MCYVISSVLNCLHTRPQVSLWFLRDTRFVCVLCVSRWIPPTRCLPIGFLANVLSFSLCICTSVHMTVRLSFWSSVPQLSSTLGFLVTSATSGLSSPFPFCFPRDLLFCMSLTVRLHPLHSTRPRFSCPRWTVCFTCNVCVCLPLLPPLVHLCLCLLFPCASSFVPVPVRCLP